MNKIALAVISGGLVLSGCSRANDEICITPLSLEASLKEPQNWVGWHNKTNACVGRWAQRLAGAPGSTREIGTAAVGGCVDAIESEASIWLKEQRERQETPDDYDQTIAHFRAEALERAMFNVAMMRSGHCAIP